MISPIVSFILQRVYKFINILIPKNRYKILFDSLPDFTDNSKAFFEYIVELGLNEKYNIIWMVYNPKMVKELRKKGIIAYENNSFKGFYHFFRSKYIFSTHNNFMEIKSSKQLMINLWHGSPLKAMGFAEEDRDRGFLPAKSNDKNYVLISTSILMKTALASCFYLDPIKVKITGQPRNDILFSKESKTNLSKLLKKDITKYKKVILYTPTFRKLDHIIDGKLSDNILNFDDYNNKEFQSFLSKNNALFLVKMHPYEEKYYSKVFKKYNKDNIVLITSEMLQSNLFDLYNIIGASDILITDYSSIYFDYLLLDQPIIFTPTDLHEYSKKRGFIVEPYDFWAPGPKAVKFKEFIVELKKCIENPDYYKSERKLVNDIVNKYQDNKSCERIFNLIFGNEIIK